MNINKSDYYSSLLDKLVIFIINQDDDEEVWREITSINLPIGYYFISNKGRVLSLYNKEPRILKPDNSSEYLRVSINGKKKYIHRLVAKSFIPKEDNKNLVHHKNGKKKDNRVINLQWVNEVEHKEIHRKLKEKKVS